MTDTARLAEPVTEERSAQLVMLDQQLALSAYLHALLQPAPVEVPTTGAPEILLAADPAPPVLHHRESLNEGLAATNSEDLEVEDPSESVIAAPAPAPDSHPDWAQQDFQCLLFRVAGLTLALPLAKLNGVLPWDAAAVTPLPNHRPWFLGLREHLGHQVKLIDVAKVVLPPDRWPAPDDGLPHGKVILIDGGRWGLVCSEVAEVIVLSAAAVKWRSQSGSRRWLAGTVIDRMCALLDSAALAEMLGGEGPVVG